MSIVCELVHYGSPPADMFLSCASLYETEISITRHFIAISFRRSMTAAKYSSDLNHEVKVKTIQRRIRAKAPRRFSVLAPRQAHMNVFPIMRKVPVQGTPHTTKNRSAEDCSDASNKQDVDRALNRICLRFNKTRI